MAFASSAVALAFAVSSLPSPAIPVDPGSQPSVSSVTDTALVTPREPGTERWTVDRWAIDAPERRPAAMLPLYVTLGAVQAVDVYSSRRALTQGASEVNPIMRTTAGRTGTMVAVKAAATAATIVFVERAWKKNRKGAVILMVAINGAIAAVSAHNLRNPSRLEQ